MIAKFAHWIPEGLKKSPRAILVVVPPSQGDGRYEINDEDWQKFCTAHDLALVACYFRDEQPGWIEDYAHVRDSASGYLLNAYLQEHFGTTAAGKLIPVPPLLLWGFSAGGQFAYEYTVNFPNNVAGFVVNKGGVYWTGLAPEPARRVPGLWIIGMKDADFRIHILLGIWGLNVRAGAKWVKFEEKSLAHEEGHSREAGREFFSNICDHLKEVEKVRFLREHLVD